jgi:hypothetical protein
MRIRIRSFSCLIWESWEHRRRISSNERMYLWHTHTQTRIYTDALTSCAKIDANGDILAVMSHACTPLRLGKRSQSALLCPNEWYPSSEFLSYKNFESGVWIFAQDLLNSLNSPALIKHPGGWIRRHDTAIYPFEQVKPHQVNFTLRWSELWVWASLISTPLPQGFQKCRSRRRSVQQLQKGKTPEGL